ncbi:MAG: acyl-ACP--UDP-N-acetylglucosamine O-acyltransferase [Pseudomonadota bacterium]
MIHPTAIVHPKADLDEGVKVGPYSIIAENVKIGKDTCVGSHVTIEDFTQIGERCNIYQFVSIGTPPQDLKFKGEKSEVIIGNNNTIREFVTINRASLHGGGITKIGNNNFLMAYCHVAHDCKIGNNTIMANAATLGGHIEIEDFAIIGGLVAIHQFVRIGAYSIIGGASGVSKNVPPYVMAVGNRAKLFGLNITGLKRNNFSESTINDLKKAYKIIFRSGMILKKALEKVKLEIPDSDEVNNLVEFIKNSERGICR